MTNKSGLVLGIFRERRVASTVLSAVHKAGFTRAAALHRLANGKLVEESHALLEHRGATIGATAGLLLGGALPLVALPRPVRLALAGAGAAIGGALGTAVGRRLQPGVPKELLARYANRVMPGESLVIVLAAASQFESVLALVRDSDEIPATFVVRPEPLPREILRASQPLSSESASVATPLLVEQWKEQATQTATRHRELPEARRSHPLLSRLRENERVIDAVCDGLAEAARLEQPVSLSSEWLLDNAYIIGSQIADTRRNLTRDFYAELPALGKPVPTSQHLSAKTTSGKPTASRANQEVPLWGTPRVYLLAWDLISHCDARLDVSHIRDYVDAYQEVTPLTMGELWALPLMLRLALIENLRRLVVQVDRRQRDRERADFWANRLLSAARPAANKNRAVGQGREERQSDQLLSLLSEVSHEQTSLPPHFADRLISHLYDEESVLVPVRNWVERRLDAPLPEIMQREQRRQARDQVAVSNAISSLRFLSQLDWREVFEDLSLVERELRGDPARVYSQMDFATRDQYRHAVERISRGYRSALMQKAVSPGIPQRDFAPLEMEVARRAVEHARAAVKTEISASTLSAESPPISAEISKISASTLNAPEQHIGFYLIDDGLPELESALSYRAPFRLALRRWIQAHPEAIYFGGLAIGTLKSLWLGRLLARRFGAASWGLAALPALLPASEIAVQGLHFLLVHLLPPRGLPKMSFARGGVPDEFRTLVVVPTLLISANGVEEDLERLEVRYLANPDANLRFALLTDFTDAAQPTLPEDAELLERVVQGIEALNHRYGAGKFLLFHRDRRWCETQNCWMGWERKRGKLEELNRFLCGVRIPDPAALHVVAGDVAALEGVRFVITLDADTQLPHDTARQMIEALAHPLNTPIISGQALEASDDGKAASDSQFSLLPQRGYTLIQPRVSTALPSATATNFSRLFTDATGTDPYTHAVSDVYQDLFCEGSYHGKGIYDLAAFYRVLEGRFPDATLLSHDLLEGAHVRVGLASDIELFDQFPSNYISYARREHRWIRGDWQILDWALNRVPTPQGKTHNPLSLLNRWKVADNLRRSLLRPLTVTALIAGWLVSPALAATASTFIGISVVVPLILQILNWLPWRNGGLPILKRDLKQGFLRTAVSVALLPHQSILSLDAIGRTLQRRKKGRGLLEWETAQVSYQSAAQREQRFLRRLAASTLFAFGTKVAILVFNRGALLYAAPYLTLWAGAPLLVKWLSSGRKTLPVQELEAEERIYLRRVARQTWRYFDDFVGPQTNWLPPDNYQESLRVEIAQRTSPTNIGLWLLSLLSAHDFGYLPFDEVISRAGSTIETLSELERYRGHLLNWYQVQTLEPLSPRYVSTVDSGNLLGSLWTMNQGVRELLDAPLLDQRALDGLRDALGLLRETMPGEFSIAWHAPAEALERLCNDPITEPMEIAHRLHAMVAPAQQLSSILGEFAAQHPAPVPANGNGKRNGNGAAGDKPVDIKSESATFEAATTDPRFAIQACSYWAAQIETQVNSWVQHLNRYLTWLERLETMPPDVCAALGESGEKWRTQLLHELPSLGAMGRGEVPELHRLVALGAAPETMPEAVLWLHELEDEFGRSRWLAGEMLGAAENLLDMMRRLSEEMQLGFLFDEERKLFSIGYNVDESRLDSSFYDLLASECRLASLIAVARGEVPLEHWMALGRRFGDCTGHAVLMSWTGTMFEYLMPLLLMRAYENSLLEEACRTAVLCQMEYGRERGVPWGISEAAFSALDAERTYQYRAFGVPGLGLKRGLEDDLVVAPYATALALPLMPREAFDNLKYLQECGLRGDYGFYESIDYSRVRLRDDNPRTVDRAQRGAIVRCFMAHHQGMSLIAIGNLLHAGIMQNRFHAEPMVQAGEALLHEKIPVAPPVMQEMVTDRPPLRLTLLEAGAAPLDRFSSPDTTVPRVHLLANEEYSLMITSAGGGYSRWRDFEITRWRADSTRDNWGSFCYVRDAESGVSWSAAHHPLRRTARQTSVHFTAEKAEFHRRDAEIETVMDVIVSSEDNAEIRRVTLVNHSMRSRTLEVTSYAELSLAPHAADRAHPAFSKLFIQTEAVPELGALLAWRRPRKPEDDAVWAGHLLSCSFPASTFNAENSQNSSCDPEQMPLEFETDRAQFLGRNRTAENPQALESPLSNTAGAVLDPVFSLRRTVTLAPGQRVELAFVTAAGDDRLQVLSTLQKYSELDAVNRAFDVAWTNAQLEMHHLRIHPEDAGRFQQLASVLIYPFSALRAPAKRIRDNRKGQSGLWAYGISGDLPILVVTIDDLRDINVVREALLAHTYWRVRGFKADLVVLNEQASSYNQDLTGQIGNLIVSGSQLTGTNKPGGVFLRSADTMPEEDLNLLLSVARAVLVAARGPLAQQLSSIGVLPPPPPRLVVTQRPAEEPSAPLPFMELPYFNGVGGFAPDGREYAIYLGSERNAKSSSEMLRYDFTVTPAPWINVLANPHFGALVSESGMGFSWFGNSQSNRLTPWSNDPVSDPSEEGIYIRDEDSGVYWSPTPGPIREIDAYRTRHGQGYTTWEHNSHAIEQELVTFVPVSFADAGLQKNVVSVDSEIQPNEQNSQTPTRNAVLIHRLRLRNNSSRRRRLTVTFYADLLLGTTREETQPHIVTQWDAEQKILLAHNSYHPDFGSRVAYAASVPRAASFTADRTGFLGRNGSPTNPAAMRRKHLSERAGVAFDACAALQVLVELDPGKETEVTFLLGEAASIDEVHEHVTHWRQSRAPEKALQGTRDFWDQLCGTLQVETPVLGVDFLLNRWLPYQVLSCRVWGRSAFYQSGGAFGFRDQLQDVMAMVYAAPEVTREQIINAAAHQFEEGDVQHWWHPPSGAGVRTMISDDLLFLPYVVAHYIRVTGDETVLDEIAPFLHAEPLGEDEHEKYIQPETSPQSADIFEHCRRAMERGCTTGPHGLPLMGAGDWNDGMNRVGIEGKGESVWLAWFAIEVLNNFAEVCAARGEAELAKNYRAQARAYARNIEKHAWDGDWYLRAFFDDGSLLGSHSCEEGRIDALPQAWSVLSGAGKPERTETALASMEEHLVRRDEKMVLLFTPPFDDGPQNPGYIKGYLPGVRENGGQYTHAAIWAVMSFARRGDGDKAVELLRMISPVEHALTPEDVEQYKVEPYAVAADIYALPGHVGRGGWTWYTGSASWMYRAWIEEVLGFQLRADSLSIEPTISSQWKTYKLHYRYKSALYHITVENPDGVQRGVRRVEVDGKTARNKIIKLVDDGAEHEVRVVMGESDNPRKPAPKKENEEV